MSQYQWAVVGAGPAGIAAVGKLIDHKINPRDILWIDPSFTVGDFGTKWRHVPSNTKVKLFLKFLTASTAFAYQNNFPLDELNPDDTCQLSLMAEPLAYVTEQLKTQVTTVTGTVQKLKLTNRVWQLTLGENNFYAKKVILAIGATPKTLTGSQDIIPLETALNPEQLMNSCTKKDVVAVYGSSHSAVLILRTLLEQCSVKKVINFYQVPLCYALQLEDCILFDNTGLKGSTAEWAKDNIDGVLPERLQRVLVPSDNQHLHLLECTKTIYAIGFESRSILVEGMHQLKYNEFNGIIAPGLFGFGIAFPEAKRDKFGSLEHQVGLWKFMDYLTKIMPVWLQYGV